jgi:hypothetical protein
MGFQIHPVTQKLGILCVYCDSIPAIDPVAGRQGQALVPERLPDNCSGVEASPLAMLDVIISMVQGRLCLTFRTRHEILPTTFQSWIVREVSTRGSCRIE